MSLDDQIDAATRLRDDARNAMDVADAAERAGSTDRATALQLRDDAYAKHSAYIVRERELRELLAARGAQSGGTP